MQSAVRANAPHSMWCTNKRITARWTLFQTQKFLRRTSKTRVNDSSSNCMETAASKSLNEHRFFAYKRAIGRSSLEFFLSARKPSSHTKLDHTYNDNNNNNNQYIYKQRQSHAMSQRRWLATAVIFRPSDMSLGFAET